MSETCHVKVDLRGTRLVISGTDPHTRETKVFIGSEDSLDRINQLSEQYRSLIARRSFAAEDDQGVLASLREIGRRIYSLFFADLEPLMESCSDVLIDHGIYLLPLEIAHDGHEFLGTKYAVGNWIRHLGQIRRWSPSRSQCHLLLLGDENPSVLDHLNYITPKFYCESPREESYWKILDRIDSRDYDILHLACHAHFDEANPDDSFLVLDSSNVHTPATNLLRWTDLKRVRLSAPLVFGNFCQSGRITDKSLGAANIAEALLNFGNSCIVTQWSISDVGAARLASYFYSNLLAGERIGEALRKARVSTWLGGKDILTSLSYILFGDPSTMLKEPGPELDSSKPNDP